MRSAEGVEDGVQTITLRRKRQVFLFQHLPAAMRTAALAVFVLEGAPATRTLFSIDAVVAAVLFVLSVEENPGGMTGPAGIGPERKIEVELIFPLLDLGLAIDCVKVDLTHLPPPVPPGRSSVA